MHILKLIIGIIGLIAGGFHTIQAMGQMDLHEAARLGRITMVQQMLQGGASVNMTKAQYLNAAPLHLAVYNGYADVVETLIQHGAQVNHQLDTIKTTPLHIAAMKGRAQIARMLIKAGANVHAKNSDNMTPLHSCAESGKLDLIQFLPVRVPDQKKPDTFITQFISENIYVTTAKVLLEAGAFLDDNPIKGTPLHLAARHGNADLVSLFINRGANLSARRPISATPLHEAVVGSAAEIAKQAQMKPESLSLLRAFICTPSKSVMREARVAVFPALCCMQRLAKEKDVALLRSDEPRLPSFPKDIRKLLIKYCLAAALVPQQLKELKRLFELKMKFAAFEFTPSQLAAAQAGNGSAPGLKALALILDPQSVEQHSRMIYTHLMKFVVQNQL